MLFRSLYDKNLWIPADQQIHRGTEEHVPEGRGGPGRLPLPRGVRAARLRAGPRRDLLRDEGTRHGPSLQHVRGKGRRAHVEGAPRPGERR